MDNTTEILNRDWSKNFEKFMFDCSTDKNDTEAFIKMMQNRIIVSHYKYGWMSKNYPELVQSLPCIEQRLECYKKEKNTEYLIDIANFAMIEYLFPCIKTTSNTTEGLFLSSDHLSMIEYYIDLYKTLGNKQYLMDLAVDAEREFYSPSIEKAVFKARRQ